ncbi:hypothetical protein V5O48_015019, partial [Marasmius crinis-equi]
EAGDKICIFGFSRGAYTARALAGMIHKVGLLPRCNHEQVPFAYKMYSWGEEKGRDQSRIFKETFSINVDIELLGLWDTVSSVGIIPKRLPLDARVKYFRHAIALDERRVRFRPNLWHLELPSGPMPKAKPEPVHKRSGSESDGDLERQYSGDGDLVTDVEEVWFAGCHCDVGGGAVPNKTRNSLARIPLRWMIRQCFLLNTGILFHREMLRYVGMDPADPAKLYTPVSPKPRAQSAPALRRRQGSAMTPNSRLSFWTDDFLNEEQEDLRDALSPMNDMLSQNWAWWILEVLPLQRDEDYAWLQWIIWNLGGPRHIPRIHDTPTKVHQTVKIRMEAKPEELGTRGKYKPRSKFSNHVWVV